MQWSDTWRKRKKCIVQILFATLLKNSNWFGIVCVRLCNVHDGDDHDIYFQLLKLARMGHCQIWMTLRLVSSLHFQSFLLKPISRFRHVCVCVRLIVYTIRQQISSITCFGQIYFAAAADVVVVVWQLSVYLLKIIDFCLLHLISFHHACSHTHTHILFLFCFFQFFSLFFLLILCCIGFGQFLLCRN